MAKIVEFKARKGDRKPNPKRNISALQAQKLERKGCISPITVTRPDRDVLAMSFRLDCFEANILNNSIRLPGYGQDHWRLYKAKKDSLCYHPMCVTYLAHVMKEPTMVSLDDFLTQIVAMEVREIYIGEVSAWGRKVDVSELAMPYKVGIHDGLNTDRKTVELLRRAGFKNALDVAKTTREELCQIPGMTTRGVSKIEKALASRGMFLDTATVPAWKE